MKWALAGMVATVATVACGGSGGTVAQGDGVAESPLSACAPVPPTERKTSPMAAPLDERAQRSRDLAEQVLREHAVTLDNPWALGHALLALGPEVLLPSGEGAVEGLFRRYGQWIPGGVERGVMFPRSVGDVRVEPHTALLLKAFTETGVDPTREVSVEGRATTVASLYCGTQYRSWVDGDQHSFESWNDTPWALQGLAAWSPVGTEWVAGGGHAMELRAFSSGVVDVYHQETQFLRTARAKNASFEKRKQGVFGYTCGGAHLLQAAAYAVGRGHGGEEDAVRLGEAQHNLMARYGVEMRAVDTAIKAYPKYELKLRIQRLKFLGHYLESMHKLGAMGMVSVTPQAQSSVDEAREELVVTLETIEKLGWFDNLEAIRSADEQAYLDLLGDTAHALRGLDLSSGEGSLLL